MVSIPRLSSSARNSPYAAASVNTSSSGATPQAPIRPRRSIPTRIEHVYPVVRAMEVTQFSAS